MGRWFRILGAALFIGVLLFPHPMEATDLSSCITQADPTGAGDAADQINACVAALPPSGGVCDARCLKSTQSASTPIQLTGKSIILLLDPSLVLTCTATANPCLQYGNNVQIIGATGDGSGSVATIKTGDSMVTLLAATEDPTMRSSCAARTLRLTLRKSLCP